MKLSITTANDDLFTLEVLEDIEIENLKAYCEVETRLPVSQLTLLFNGNPLTEGKRTAASYGIKDGDMLFLQASPNQSSRAGGTTASYPELSQIDFRALGRPRQQRSRPPAQRGETDPMALREALLASPRELALLRQNNSPLAEALESNDPERFREVFTEQAEAHRRKRAEEMALLTGDPFDPEVQRKIAEQIQQENVNANMEAAMEYAPESFGQVHMLYIDCIVNGHPVKAFVDSGAQMTIMSETCADRCNISHLIDKRWQGIAKGVGIQRVLGKVHMCQISINNDHLQCSFSILEDQPMDMLLGLDMLKRHQCTIDLKNDMLVIGTTGTVAKFLPESELPSHARLNRSTSEVEQERKISEAILRSAEESKPSTSRADHEEMVSLSSRTTSHHSEDSIQNLVANGISRAQAIQELDASNGDANKALINALTRNIGKK